MTKADIIPDAEIISIHAGANFGDMTPRAVVDEGVDKVSRGYHCGSTMSEILIEHGLAHRRHRESPKKLTAKGKLYMAALKGRRLRTELSEKRWAVINEASGRSTEWIFDKPQNSRAAAIAKFCYMWQRAIDLDANYTVEDFKNDPKLRAKYWRRLKPLYNVRVQSVLVVWNLAG